MPLPISLNLKQKLSNLALSSPLSTSPGSGPSSSSNRRLPFRFGRQDSHESIPDVDYDDISENERIDEAIHGIISQAGVDFETRPMVVITASQMPDPRQISYDRLLTRMIQFMDLYVESDYVIIFLAAGGRHSPPWNWIWKAYRSLSRKYRKNLKKLYIVHSTTFSKMLFSLAGTVISPKFFRKIQYIPTLSALASYVPLTNLDLHPAVYQENLKHEKQILLPSKHQEPSLAFGVSLDKLMGEYGETSGVPRVIKDSVEYIRIGGMEVEGLFRRSPNSVLLRQAKEAYDRGQTVSLASFGDPHIAAVLLKKFFHDLPEPIFTEAMYPVIRRCPPATNDPGDLACVDFIRENILPIVERNSPATMFVLSFVLHLLHDVSIRSKVNKMDAHNLALCFSPNLVSGSNIFRDTQMCAIPDGPSIFPFDSTASSVTAPGKTHPSTLGSVIKVCIERYFEIFEELPDRTTAIASHPSMDSGLLSSPSTTSRELTDSFKTPERSNVIHSFSPASDSELDDDDMDESMLVMPIGPSPASPAASSRSAWPSPTSKSSPAHGRLTGLGHPSSSARRQLNLQKQSPSHRRNNSSLSGFSPITSKGLGANPSASTGRFSSIRASSVIGVDGNSGVSRLKTARSIISIERTRHGDGSSGSITIGKGGSRRTSGAGVEALGVTASGFFSPVTTPDKRDS